VKKPFDDLARRRAANQNRELLKAKHKERLVAQGKVDRSARAAEKRNYDDMVTEVLTSLQKAAFSGLKFRSDDESWSIGLWLKGNDGAAIWHKTLEVRLVFDEVDGRPSYFECTRHNQQLWAELNRQSLQEALHRLVPLPEPKAFRLARRAAKERFDPLVQEAYRELRKSGQQDLSLAGDVDQWSIGHWQARGEDLEWQSAVMIRLRFDWLNRPKGFICSTLRHHARAGLSVEELTNALRELMAQASTRD